MKKLTKMDIDALRETLPVLSREEQRMYMGMYSGDCFWKCVASLNSGDYSEPAVAALVFDYWVDRLGSVDAANEQLMYTSFISPQEARDFWQANGAAYNSPTERIVCIDPNNVDDYGQYYHYHGFTGSSGHYVVVFDELHSGPEGNYYNAYDPSLNKTFKITEQELGNSDIITP